MEKLKNRIFIALSVMMLSFIGNGCQSNVEEGGSREIVLENSIARLVVERAGGMFTCFELKERAVNPFTWRLSCEQMPRNNRPFVFKGHFLCSGRWGAPNPGEILAGIPHNGEVNTVIWDVEESTVDTLGMQRLKMRCESPLERLDVERVIFMPQDGTWFFVEECFQNHLPIGRPVNFVQHATIGAPFLTPNLVVNTNAQQGFDQRAGWGNHEAASFVWPHGKLSSGEEVDLRRIDVAEGFVTSHVFALSDSIGWVTAWNPDNHLLMGYVFKTSDYRWFNYWNHWENGVPIVRGLEFGTTGVGEPYGTLLSQQSRFFGVPYFQYLDAGECDKKSWLCFQIMLEPNLENVLNIQINDGDLNVVFEDKDGRVFIRALDCAGSYLCL